MLTSIVSYINHAPSALVRLRRNQARCARKGCSRSQGVLALASLASHLKRGDVLTTLIQDLYKIVSATSYHANKG